MVQDTQTDRHYWNYHVRHVMSTYTRSRGRFHTLKMGVSFHTAGVSEQFCPSDLILKLLRAFYAGIDSVKISWQYLQRFMSFSVLTNIQTNSCAQKSLLKTHHLCYAVSVWWLAMWTYSIIDSVDFSSLSMAAVTESDVVVETRITRCFHGWRCAWTGCSTYSICFSSEFIQQWILDLNQSSCKSSSLQRSLCCESNVNTIML